MLETAQALEKFLVDFYNPITKHEKHKALKGPPSGKKGISPILQKMGLIPFFQS